MKDGIVKNTTKGVSRHKKQISDMTHAAMRTMKYKRDMCTLYNNRIYYKYKLNSKF